jgi:hypothetical protein
MFGKIVRIKGYGTRPLAGIAQGAIEPDGTLPIAYLEHDSGRIVPHLDRVYPCREGGSLICWELIETTDEAPPQT